MSGEDLANTGPVSLLQDLAMMALLGITHVERNGHHYFRGLSAFPQRVQEGTLLMHEDLYERREYQGETFPTLRIQEGQVEVGSVNEAPFGSGIVLDMDAYEPLNTWIKRGGMAG